MSSSWSLSVLLFILALPFSVASGFTGEVVGVLDGDTIEVLHNGKAQRVRLCGIDCPETSVLVFAQYVTQPL
jgi:micrococcal nuclease